MNSLIFLRHVRKFVFWPDSCGLVTAVRGDDEAAGGAVALKSSGEDVYCSTQVSTGNLTQTMTRGNMSLNV